MTGTINSKALTQAAEQLAEAVQNAELAYQFCPGSYTWTALCRCLAAAKAFDQHVEELAFSLSAEWLRMFPRIVEVNDES